MNYQLNITKKKYICVIDQLNNLYLLVLMCKAALLSTIILILHAQAQILENFPPPPEKADAQSEGQLIRLRDVQLKGQSFAQTLKRLGPKLTINEQILSSKGTRRLLVEDPVQNRINSFPSAPKVEQEDKQIGSEAGVFEGQVCSFDIYSYSNPTNEFLHYDSQNSNIFPGSVLKSSYLKGVMDGTQSQQPIPAGPLLKNPSISIIDKPNFNIFTQIYSFHKISQAISRSIGLSALQNKQNSIFFQMDTTDNLADLSRRMSFNAGLLKELGIQSPNQSPYNRYEKKIIFMFTKPLGHFDAVIKSFHQDLKDSPLNTFYSPDLTLKVFDSKTPQWWGPKSPPVYIDSVIYGSIIIMTVNYDKITLNLMKELEEEANNRPQAAQKIIKVILSQPSLKIFSRGPFSTIDLVAIKDGNWKEMFLRVPSDSSSRVIQPIYYTVKDFKEDKYYVANQYKYVKVCASPPPLITYKILVKLEQVLNQAPVIIIVKALSGQVILRLNFYSATVFDLTPYLNDPQMIVIIRPTVSCSCPSKRQQVKAGFIVNNVYTQKLQVSCAGVCYENDAGTYSVKKDVGQISP